MAKKSDKLVKDITSIGAKGTVNSKVLDAMKNGTYKNPGVDCSEIVEDLYNAAGKQGVKYNITGKGPNGWMKGYEYGKVEEDGSGKSVDNKQNYSLLIANVLTKRFSFDFARLSMYHHDDIYFRIPRLIFRLKSVDINKYGEIKDCVETFNGNLKWTLYKSFFSRKNNYIIAPFIVYEIERDYFLKGTSIEEEEIISTNDYKNICDKAIEDIPNLADHIIKYFKIN